MTEENNASQSRRKKKSTRRKIRWWRSSEPHPAPLHFWEVLDRLRYVIVALALIAVAMLVLRIPPVANAWQEFNLVRNAQRIAASGKVTVEDFDILSRANARAPGRPVLLRGLAAAAAERDPALARRCYDRIAELGALVPADTARRAMALVRLHDLEGARAMLGQTTEISSAGVETLLARLMLAREEGDFPAAAEALGLLSQRNESDIPECLATVEAAVRSGADPSLIDRLERCALDACEQSAAAGRVEEIGNTVMRLTALPMRGEENRMRALKMLGCLDSAPVEQRLAVVLFSLATYGADAAEVRRVCLAEIHRGTGLTVLQESRVADLLQQRGEHALVADIITRAESLAEPSLFRQRLESLMQLGNWREAAAMAAASPDALPQRRHLLACLATMEHDMPGSPNCALLMPGALMEASEAGSAPACFVLGCAALELKLDSYAAEAFSAALALPTADASLAEAMLKMARGAGLNAAKTLQMLTNQHHASPLNPAIQTRLCYLRLLACKDAPVVQKLLKDLSAERSKDPYVQFLQAIQLHQSGDFAGAANHLCQLPRGSWQQGEAALIASMIAVTGKIQECDILVEGFDPMTLFPEERTMIERCLNRIGSTENILSLSSSKRIPDEEP